MEETLQTGYIVKAGNFEGPLELLLSLIESRKLFINEVSLATVTEDYISFIRSNKEIPVSSITSFVVVAATLVLIKSRSLLPNLALSKDEEKDISDLERRLKLLQKAQEGGELIKKLFGKRYIFPGTLRRNSAPVWSPDPKITIEIMLASLKGVINEIPVKESIPEVEVMRIMSIDEMIGNLSDRIQTALTLQFSDISRNTNPHATPKEQKVYTIVSFLAMLELVRTGIIDVLQSNDFDSITIHKQTESQP
jgi:segregation and condensation protein A